MYISFAFGSVKERKHLVEYNADVSIQCKVESCTVEIRFKVKEELLKLQLTDINSDSSYKDIQCERGC